MLIVCQRVSKAHRIYSRFADPERKVTLSEGLLGEAAPLRYECPAIAGRGAGGLDGAGVDVAGFGGAAGAFEGLAVVVEAFRVVFAALGVEGELSLGIGDAVEGEVDGAEVAVHLARGVLLVLAERGFEMRQRIVEAALFAGDAAELVVGVGLGWVDGDGGLEAADGFRVLPALLVDQTELVLRLAVVRIDRGGFEHPAVVLAAAESRAEAGEFAAEVIDQIEEEERRGERRKIIESGPQRRTAPARGIQERQTIPAAAPLLAPKTVRTAKKISTAK